MERCEFLDISGDIDFEELTRVKKYNPLGAQVANVDLYEANVEELVGVDPIPRDHSYLYQHTTEVSPILGDHDIWCGDSWWERESSDPFQCIPRVSRNRHIIDEVKADAAEWCRSGDIWNGESDDENETEAVCPIPTALDSRECREESITVFDDDYDDDIMKLIMDRTGRTKLIGKYPDPISYTVPPVKLENAGQRCILSAVTTPKSPSAPGADRELADLQNILCPGSPCQGVRFTTPKKKSPAVCKPSPMESQESASDTCSADDEPPIMDRETFQKFIRDHSIYTPGQPGLSPRPQSPDLLDDVQKMSQSRPFQNSRNFSYCGAPPTKPGSQGSASPNGCVDATQIADLERQLNDLECKLFEREQQEKDDIEMNFPPNHRIFGKSFSKGYASAIENADDIELAEMQSDLQKQIQDMARETACKIEESAPVEPKRKRSFSCFTGEYSEEEGQSILGRLKRSVKGNRQKQPAERGVVDEEELHQQEKERQRNRELDNLDYLIKCGVQKKDDEKKKGIKRLLKKGGLSCFTREQPEEEIEMKEYDEFLRMSKEEQRRYKEEVEQQVRRKVQEQIRQGELWTKEQEKRQQEIRQMKEREEEQRQRHMERLRNERIKGREQAEREEFERQKTLFEQTKKRRQREGENMRRYWREREGDGVIEKEKSREKEISPHDNLRKLMEAAEREAARKKKQQQEARNAFDDDDDDYTFDPNEDEFWRENVQKSAMKNAKPLIEESEEDLAETKERDRRIKEERRLKQEAEEKRRVEEVRRREAEERRKDEKAEARRRDDAQFERDIRYLPEDQKRHYRRERKKYIEEEEKNEYQRMTANQEHEMKKKREEEERLHIRKTEEERRGKWDEDDDESAQSEPSLIAKMYPSNKEKHKTPLKSLGEMPIAKIANRGNNCYLISSLQLLATIRPYDWTDDFTGQVFRSMCENPTLSRLLTPEDMDRINLIPSLIGWPDNRQQDAYEFLIKFLNFIHINTQTQGLSMVSFMFNVLENRNTKCRREHCAYQGNALLTLENLLFKTNELPIDNLSRKTEIQILDWKCDYCESKGCTNTKTIVEFPVYLFVVVDRFGLADHKDQYPVEIRQRLKGNGVFYELIGFINHIGSSIESGHYTATVKRNQWKHYDDDKEVEILESIPKTSKSVYIMLYRLSTQTP